MRDKVSVPAILVKGNLCGRAFYRDLLDQLEEGSREFITASLNSALEQEVTHLLGREFYVRWWEGDEKRVAAYCLRCHSRRRRDFVRNGHKERGLVTLWGSDLRIWMPPVECRACGGTVHVAYETIPPRQRIWQEVRAGAKHAGDQREAG